MSGRHRKVVLQSPTPSSGGADLAFLLDGSHGAQ